MAKDPAFLFYTGDFSTGTQFFTDEQVGKYIRLLMAQHQHGHLTDQQVNFICKSYDNEVLKKFTKDDNGLWYNERLEVEIEKRKSYSISRGNNRKGAKNKEVKVKKEPKNISKSYDFHMENENEIKDEYKSVVEKWLLYKKSRGEKYKNRDSILLMYRKLFKFSEGDHKTALSIIEDAMSNNYAGFFKPKNQGVAQVGTVIETKRLTDAEKWAKFQAEIKAREQSDIDAFNRYNKPNQ